MNDADALHPIAPHGTGLWAHEHVEYSWSLQDVSHLHARMNSSGRAIFFVLKARLKERGLFKKLLWIQYTEALLDGKVYAPAPTPTDPNPWPWMGIDRYPNTAGRKDNLPYTSLPDEQDRVNWGHAYEGRIKGLYKPDADTIDVDWASSGGMSNWGHYSVTTLIGRGYTGREWSLGSLMWRWSTDASGELAEFGAAPASEQDIARWTDAMNRGNPDYMNNVHAGVWHPGV